MAYRVQTQGFSGPFDLLLALVSKQKLSIASISISELTDQYLDEVERMGEMDLDIASDFVLVASTLLDMKAASLVPLGIDHSKHENDEDFDLEDLSPEEAREVLIERLIAYKQYRNVAAALSSRMESEARMYPRSVGPDLEFLNLMPDYLEGISLRSLAVICADLMSQRESVLLEAEHIAPKRIPIALTAVSVDRVLRNKKRASFSSLLNGQDTPEIIVSTFLAVLELYKRGLIKIAQSTSFGEIDIEHVEGAEEYVVEENSSEYEDEEW